MGLVIADAAAYKQGLLALLPPGDYWAELGDDIHALLDSWSADFEALHKLNNSLLDEADPRTTSSYIDEWEAFAGVANPDKSLSERRNLLLAELSKTGELGDVDVMIMVAEQMGYEVEIDELYHPVWHFGQRISEPINNLCANVHLRVRVLNSAAADAEFELHLAEVRPAHSVLHFYYEG